MFTTIRQSTTRSWRDGNGVVETETFAKSSSRSGQKKEEGDGMSYKELDGNLRGELSITLTPREEQVVGLLMKSLNCTQIAKELKVKLQTVKNQVAIIYEKLDVHNRVQLMLAMEKRKNANAAPVS